MDRLRRTGEALTVVGGAPAEIAGWIAAARQGGIARVLAAPGPKGLAAAALGELVAAGLSGLQLRLYAADTAAHDYHAGLEGSLRATVATLRLARTARLPALVTTPLTRSNARVLGALPGLLVDVAAAGWRVRVAEAGQGAQHGAVAPRLATALPHALQAMAAAQRAGVPTTIQGAPLCLLGPLRARAMRWPRRAFADRCGECEARGACPGVAAEYLDRFGGDELSPRALQASAGRSENHKGGLQDMFGGVWIELGDDGCWPI